MVSGHHSAKRGSIFFNRPVREWLAGESPHHNPCSVIIVFAVETAETTARKSSLPCRFAA